MSEHRIKVDNGKYEFHHRGGWRLNVLRYGEPWVDDLDASKAVAAMMAELDAARVVLQAARALADALEKAPLGLLEELNKLGNAPVGLVRAIARHSGLCDDREPPSPWAVP